MASILTSARRSLPAVAGRVKPFLAFIAIASSAVGWLVPNQAAGQDVQRYGNVEYVYHKDAFSDEVTEFISIESEEHRGGVNLLWACRTEHVPSVVLIPRSRSARSVRWRVDDNPPSDTSFWVSPNGEAMLAPASEGVALTGQVITGNELTVRVHGDFDEQADYTFGLAGFAEAFHRLPCGLGPSETTTAWLSAATEAAQRWTIVGAETDRERERAADRRRWLNQLAPGQTVHLARCEIGSLVRLRRSPSESAPGVPIPDSDLCSFGGPEATVLRTREVNGVLWLRVRVDQRDQSETGWVASQHVAPPEHW